MPSWKKVILSGSDAALNSLDVTTNVTATSFTGSLSGTASYADQALTASFAISASYSPGTSQNLQQVTDNGNTTTNNIVVGGITASNLIYPSTDGTVNQAIVTDGAGNLTFGDPLSSNTIVFGKNVSGGTIEKGTPLYFTASGTSGNIVGVLPRRRRKF